MLQELVGELNQYAIFCRSRLASLYVSLYRSLFTSLLNHVASAGRGARSVRKSI